MPAFFFFFRVCLPKGDIMDPGVPGEHRGNGG